jgi:hypothetical protein
MRDSWVGLQAGVDARKWAGVLARAHDAAVRGGHVPTIVRGVIADSWERCAETGVDPVRAGAPLVVEPDEAVERWREHPLAQTTDVLRGVLGELLYEARHIVVVSDADGCLLWSDGHPDVLRKSEDIRFSPGHAWSEDAAGTNAVGTALATDHAVQVFSAEHFRSEIHGWQCSGAPIHDPETGALLGAVDVSGRYDTASPHTLALVQMAARLVEERLRAQMLERDGRILELFAQHASRHRSPAAALSPSGRILAATGDWPPPTPLTRGGRLDLPERTEEVEFSDGTGAAVHPLGEGRLVVAAGRRARVRARSRTHGPRIELLGSPRGRLMTAGGELTHRLTARHSEIVALLALHPEGMDARALSAALYGSAGHEVAVRAECHRLRETLGSALATRPYRLEGLEVDLALVLGGLAGRDGRGGQRRAAAVARDAGELLPDSSVPEIVAARASLRAAAAA